MTTNVNVTWDLPTTRTSGKPLELALIAGVDVSLSADAGANFVVTDTVLPADTQEVLYPDLVDGDYVVRLVVRLTTGQSSVAIDTPVALDTSTPSAVTNVNVTLS